MDFKWKKRETVCKLVSRFCFRIPPRRKDAFNASLLFPLQPQTIRHHAHAAQRHGRPGNHRVEQETVDGIKDAGGNGNADNVVNKRPEQILTNGSDGLPRQADGLRNFCQVGRDDGHFGHVHSDIAPVFRIGTP